MDPKEIVKEWIFEELGKRGKKGTDKEYRKVVNELPDLVTRRDIENIVGRLFPHHDDGGGTLG